MKTKDFSERPNNGELPATQETQTACDMYNPQKEKQRVSLRTVARRALVIFLPLATLLGGVLAVFYYINVRAERRIITSTEPRVAELQRETIARNFQSIISDVMILSQSESLRKILDGHEGSKNELANEFFAFSERKRCYDQLRYLDGTGMEIVRVNFNDGKPSRVPDEKLQSKGNRYYFTDAFALNKGEVFVSPLDLNVEHGVIERPLKENVHPGEAAFVDSIWRQAKGEKYVKPIIRFATPVCNSDGQKKGIVLANFLGVQLTNVFNEIGRNSLGRCFLVNRDGFWLKGPNCEVEWGFMREHDKEQTFGNTFREAWPRISKQESGQFYTADGLFTFTSIYPLLEGLKTSTGSGQAFKASTDRLKAGEYCWKVVSHIPPSVLCAKGNALAGLLLTIGGLLTIILAGSSWLLAWNGVFKQQAEEATKLAYGKLKEANQELKEMQSQLVQSEKMASIGQLAAGVAHEMNTPVGFVASNFETLEGYVRKFKELLEMYDELGGRIETSEKTELLKEIDAIRQSRDDKKINFAIEDIQELLDDSKEGLSRVANIIQNLRDFSRIDQVEDFDEYDINPGIEATLVVARNEIKYDADIKTDLSELPHIYCNAGQVNQVFLNIFINASQAIKSREGGDKGTITVKTYATDEKVVCEIADNGCGIAPENLSKVFDPFFTTKPVGKGTGLGLSVSYDIIVNKHKGELLADSTVGKGTTFTIKLPTGRQDINNKKETEKDGTSSCHSSMP